VKRWALSEDGFAGKHLVGAHVKHDAHQFRVWTGKTLDEIGCTLGDVQHMAALLDDKRRVFALDKLAVDFLGGEHRKLDLDVRGGAQRWHAAEVAAYAVRDATLVQYLYEKMLPMLAAQDLLEVMRLEDACILPTLEMEWNGSILDEELLDKWCARSERELYALLWELADLAGWQVNPKSAKDLEKLFYKLGLEPVVLWDPKLKESRVTYKDEALARYDHVPAIALSRRVLRLESVRSKYLLKYRTSIRRTGVLRYALNQLRADENQGGAISGRYSCSAFKFGRGKSEDDEEGANAQQVKAVAGQRDEWGYDEDDASHDDEIYLVRKLYVAPDGRRYWAADAAQIEYRTFAHFSEDPGLLCAYAENPNINFHKHVDMILRKAGVQIPYKHVKNVNFAKLFGAGAQKLAWMMGTSEDEARKIISNYDRAFPAASRMMRKATALAEKRGWVRSVSGRRARFQEGDRFYTALNRVIQGSAADINKRKLVRLYEARKDLDLTMRLTVHDEVVGDVPDDRSAERCNAILNQQDYPLRVPILWKGKTGQNWSECA